jgi:hypothetical protein
MRYINSILLILFSQLSVHAQGPVAKSPTQVSFLFLNNQPKDSSDMNLLIIYKNNSKKTDSVYWSFKDGYMGDEDFNLHITMEKLKDKKYSNYPLYFYQKFNSGDQMPNNECLDLPKKAILPMSTDTVVYNLLKSGRLFEEGKYRFKAFVRTRCRFEHGRGSEDKPSFPNIDYVNSGWLYFVVKKAIFVEVKPL